MPTQLAREYVLVTREAKNRHPLLILVLGDNPPVKVNRHGRQGIKDAINLYLDSVFQDSENHPYDLKKLQEMIDSTVCWITWRRIKEITTIQWRTFQTDSISVNESIKRLVNAIHKSIEWHS